jgi:hypothetical protein
MKFSFLLFLKYFYQFLFYYPKFAIFLLYIYMSSILINLSLQTFKFLLFILFEVGIFINYKRIFYIKNIIKFYHHNN